MFHVISTDVNLAVSVSVAVGWEVNVCWDLTFS